MAGYAAVMRIERFEIRGGNSARSALPAHHPIDARAVPALVELSGREPGERLLERVEDLRVYLGQLTWYLFDAEGWR